MSLFAELQRRKVLKATGSYLVVGWLLIQVAATVAPQLNLPEWAPRLITLVILLGFPIMLVMAWVFDVTPEGLRADASGAGSKRIMAVAAVLAALALGWYFRQHAEQAPVATGSHPSAPVAATADSHSIAVLPFVDMSQAHDQEYFSDGLSEELLNLLAQLPQMRVIARTSSFSFKGQEVDVATIAKKLNVANVLEGSVRKSGNTLRITAQLIRASDSSHLWSQTYDRELTDVFKVQDDIAGAVVAALKVQLLPDQAMSNAHRSSNTEAYNQYLVGREFLQRGNADDWRRSADAYEKAIALDGNYAAAYADLASAQGNLADIEGDEKGMEQSIANAGKAISLAPNLADGYVSRGTSRLSFKKDLAGAQADYEKALALDPGNSRVQGAFGRLMIALGRIPEAITASRKATELDPLSSDSWDLLGRLYHAVGQYPASAQALDRALEVSPEAGRARFHRGIVSLLEGDATTALATFRKTSGAYCNVGVAMAEYTLGHARESQQALDQEIATYSQGAGYQIAEVYAWRGEKDKAFEWLDRGYTQHDGGLTFIKADPLLASLVGDPRYAAVLEKNGIAQVSLIAELQRRKVFKVGAAYLVVAWLAVQAASIAFPTFEAPLWALRVFILVALLGFPIALVMAWVFDVTPDGMKLDASQSGSKRVFAVTGLLIVLALGWYFYGQPAFRKGDATTPVTSTIATTVQQPSPTATPEKSIAVLPFENLSDDKANAYFTEGMQDEILTRLAGIGDLKVISRTSTKRYASRPDNLKIVGAQLGAAHILEGSVQKSGDSVRVNVQLIDARTDTHLWAQTFDRKLENVFAVESEVAQQTADVLKARLSPQETHALAQAPTSNADAYDHFLRAEFEFHRAFETQDVGNYDAADGEYEKAIALDPDFALAYARRAFSQLSMHWASKRIGPARLAEVKTWVDRALQLAPELPAAHASLAYYDYWGLRHYAEAMVEFERTVQLAPNNIDALSGMGYVHRRLGQWDEALASLQKVIAISPRDNLVIDEYGTTLVILRRYQEADVQFLRARAISTDNANGQDFLMRGRLFGFGDVAGARKIFDPLPPWRISYYTLLAGDLYEMVNPRVYPDLFERKFDAALQQWATAPQDSDEDRLTGRVARVAIQIIAGRKASIQTECVALMPLLAAKLRNEPDSLNWLQQSSWIMVCLGRNAEAIATARHATDVFPLANDKYFGVYQLEGLAEIDARAGAPDEAIEILGQLLAIPAGQSVSVERLKRDPLWDPLRQDPRFQKLLAGVGQ